MFEDWNIIMA